MALLNTQSINIGDQSFVLSEFTALDRLQGLEYQVANPAPVLGENPSEQDIARHTLVMEVYHLHQITHSLAVSLKHGNDQFQQTDIPTIQQDIQTNWPSRAINQAYELLITLNQPPKALTESEPKDDQEPVTLEKS